MANLPLDLAGLPMVVSASQRMGLPHDIRIKVMQTHGSRMDPGDLAVVAVRPTPADLRRSAIRSGSTKPC
jgi:hypothetical protein